MMTVADFTEPSLLIPQLLSADQASVINALSHRLQGAGRIADSLTFFQAVLQRDYLSSSAPGNGVAFPHAGGRGIHCLSLALGVSAAGVRWRDGSQVHAVFLIAIPPADAQLYLALVAALARLVRRDNFIHTVTTRALPAGILRLLHSEEIQVPASSRTGALERRDEVPSHGRRK